MTTAKGGRVMPKGEAIGFEQLFDDESCTYTYLLYDVVSKDAILYRNIHTNYFRLTHHHGIIGS
jgi:hypothetical protein